MVAIGGAAASAQTQFQDQRTGKVWIPEVGTSNGRQAGTEPRRESNLAFDPTTQIATADGIVVQRPGVTLLGTVPITAGPTVPIATLESPSLQPISGDRWVAPLYVTNNSGSNVDPQVGCTFTNGGRSVQETRIVLPTAGPGQRLATVAYGPRTEIFVDRVLCRLLTP
jgi:hypothetical protein